MRGRRTAAGGDVHGWCKSMRPMSMYVPLHRQPSEPAIISRRRGQTDLADSAGRRAWLRYILSYIHMNRLGGAWAMARCVLVPRCVLISAFECCDECLDLQKGRGGATAARSGAHEPCR